MLKALLPFLTNLTARAIPLAAAVTLAGIATAQNLVNNPSFEDTTHCDLFAPPFEEASYWYSANIATPDIWDCDTVDPCGNFMDAADQGIQAKGFKTAYDGDRFAGGFHWSGPGGANTREYLISKLLADLQAGRSYRVSLHCARPKGHRRAIDHIGVYFGADSIFESFPTTLAYIPQVELRDPNNAYLVDTNWVELADTLVAMGNERWLIVGTFLDDDQVNGIDLPPLWPQDKAYYYIDALSVEPLSAEGIDDPSAPVFTLLASATTIQWHGTEALDDLLVFDCSGRLVWRPKYYAGSLSGSLVVPEVLAQGTYVVSATAKGRRKVARFVK